VTALWITIVVVALASAAIRAFGPILVGGRELPPSMGAVIALLVPALLTALVLTQTFGEDGRLVLDEKAIGVAVAAVALSSGAGAGCSHPRGGDHRPSQSLRLANGPEISGPRKEDLPQNAVVALARRADNGVNGGAYRTSIWSNA